MPQCLPTIRGPSMADVAREGKPSRLLVAVLEMLLEIVTALPDPKADIENGATFAALLLTTHVGEATGPHRCPSG